MRSETWEDNAGRDPAICPLPEASSNSSHTTLAPSVNTPRSMPWGSERRFNERGVVYVPGAGSKTVTRCRIWQPAPSVAKELGGARFTSNPSSQPCFVLFASFVFLKATRIQVLTHLRFWIAPVQQCLVSSLVECLFAGAVWAQPPALWSRRNTPRCLLVLWMQFWTKVMVLGGGGGGPGQLARIDESQGLKPAVRCGWVAHRKLLGNLDSPRTNHLAVGEWGPTPSSCYGHCCHCI
jgi:hypothetical protein